MAEALAAERIHGASDVPGDVDWIGGNNPGTDITGVIGGSRVHADAHAALVEPRRPRTTSWVARKGNEIPSVTTHIALVLLDGQTDVRLTTDAVNTRTLIVQGKIAGDVYLVPADLAGDGDTSSQEGRHRRQGKERWAAPDRRRSLLTSRRLVLVVCEG